MRKYILITVILSNFIFANENHQDEASIKNDNTLVVNVDDFTISTQYPLKSNNSKELSLIIKNNSKVKFLFSLKKNKQNIQFISLDSQENYNKTISIGQNDAYTLRPLSPPSEDIAVNTFSNKDL